MKAQPGAMSWWAYDGGLSIIPILSWTIRAGKATPVLMRTPPDGGTLFAFRVNVDGDIHAWNDTGAMSWRLLDQEVLRKAYGRLSPEERADIAALPKTIPAELVKELEPA